MARNAGQVYHHWSNKGVGVLPLLFRVEQGYILTEAPCFRLDHRATGDDVSRLWQQCRTRLTVIVSQSSA